jgi:uncharacterized protein YecE (DUF72 family)
MSGPRHPDRVSPRGRGPAPRDYGDAGLVSCAERIRGQNWSEAYVFFKHEDDGTAPIFARRLIEVMGAEATPV